MTGREFIHNERIWEVQERAYTPMSNEEVYFCVTRGVPAVGQYFPAHEVEQMVKETEQA